MNHRPVRHVSETNIYANFSHICASDHRPDFVWIQLNRRRILLSCQSLIVSSVHTKGTCVHFSSRQMQFIAAIMRDLHAQLSAWHFARCHRIPFAISSADINAAIVFPYLCPRRLCSLAFSRRGKCEIGDESFRSMVKLSVRFVARVFCVPNLRVICGLITSDGTKEKIHNGDD